MKENFININYLKFGNTKQKRAYETLNEINIFNILKKFSPILVGTIPIGIDLVNSDLDIVCEVYNIGKFEKLLKENFSRYNEFKVSIVSNKILTSNFFINDFEVEIYAEDIKSSRQNGYRHMIIESRILELGGDKVRKEIIKLKERGMKTETAFANYLRLNGDPYKELLQLETFSDDEIKKILNINEDFKYK